LSDSPIKVSVAMITYNHEKFIAKALDSVLMQETSFDYEIIIGEDRSIDDTRSIVIDYQKRYPAKIRLLLNEKNLGGNRNAAQVHRACTGSRVAWIEGDDYWTSPHKLQKQVDFLDGHPECSICFHDVMVIHTDGMHEPANHRPANQKEFSTIEDLLLGNFIPTCSTMYRNGLIEEIPDWFYALPWGDWAFHILNAKHGRIGYINEVMGVWVIHPGGQTYRAIPNLEQEFRDTVSFYNGIIQGLEHRHQRIAGRALSHYCLEISRRYENMGQVANARAYGLKCLTKHFSLSTSGMAGKTVLRLSVPKSYRILRSLKRAVYTLPRAIHKT
jgi:glycosyltransferase involved in cell wall biosynthesis